MPTSAVEAEPFRSFVRTTMAMTSQAIPRRASGYFVTRSMSSTRSWRPPEGLAPAMIWRRRSSLRRLLLEPFLLQRLQAPDALDGGGTLDLVGAARDSARIRRTHHNDNEASRSPTARRGTRAHRSSPPSSDPCHNEASSMLSISVCVRRQRGAECTGAPRVDTLQAGAGEKRPFRTAALPHRACVRVASSAPERLKMTSNRDRCRGVPDDEARSPMPSAKARRCWAGMLGLTLVTAITATVVVSPGPVAADQVSDLKAQAAQIAQDLVLEQLQIGAYQQQYDVDVAKVQQDEAEIGSTQDQIQADISRVRRDRKRLQAEAVSAYINLDPEVDGTEPCSRANQSEALARGGVRGSGERRHRAHHRRSPHRRERLACRTCHARTARGAGPSDHQPGGDAGQRGASDRGRARRPSSPRSPGELAAAVAQQQAAQAAAAAAAVRAAQAAAAAAATLATASGLRRARRTTAPAATAVTDHREAPPARRRATPSLPPFLQCVLQVESGGNYDAVSPGGTYMGGFQFSQPTWNEAAQLAGMPQLINVPPNEATPAEQDDLAIALYDADGQQPWDDSCRGG